MIKFKFFSAFFATTFYRKSLSTYCSWTYLCYRW